MNTKLKVLIYGIKVKMKNGQQLDDILGSYTKLTPEEKELIRGGLPK